MSPRILSAFEIVTVGLPFCVFKILTGLFLLSVNGWMWLGALLLALGATDIVINFVNLVGVTFIREQRLLGVCAIHQAVLAFKPRRAAWTEVATSADVLLSFTIVAAMLGSMTLMQLPLAHRSLWTLCTVLNVLGAGLGRVVSSVRELAASRLNGAA